MLQYLQLLKEILEKGQRKEDRTNTGTISIFGYQNRYHLEDGFPLLTTKKVFYRGIIEELLWIIRGETNIYSLVTKNVNIWNDWPYAKYKNSNEYQNETMLEFIEKIKNNQDFAIKWGDLGAVYGKQWRDFFKVDQLLELVESLKNNPSSRRHIICAWNPAQLNEMALPPCHAFLQCYVVNNTLSLQLYQRSADVFLGVPFNIASYSLFLLILCHSLNFKVGDFIHTFGDAHIYLNHLPQVQEQLQREPRKLPKLIIKCQPKPVTDYTIEDFEIVDYDPYPTIKGVVSV
ncbi:MAG: thymidylate synthase [Bacillales bacterium]|jgi:thymidylate synthase|nr:thymidylate synthase [Bacillales bacterium]